MNAKDKTTITRVETSIRLIEAAHQMFSKNIDDLALLTIIGAVHTAAYEELKLDETDNESNEANGLFSKEDKKSVDLWFNFLKHGSRGPRSLGDEMDIGALAGEDKDILLFGYLWKSTIVHVAAYQKRTELIDIIITLGQLAFGDDEEDETYDPKDQEFLCKNIRWMSQQWYTRDSRAKENGVDRKSAHKKLDEYICSPLENLVGKFPKQPVRNRQQRRQEKKLKKSS